MGREYSKQRKLIVFGLFLTIYTLSALVGYSASGLLFPALIWPAAGIALGVLFLGGINLWPAIFIGALAASLFQGVPLGAAILLAIGITIENIVGAYILLKTNFSPLLGSLRDVILLILVSAGISIIGPLFGAFGLYFSGVPLITLELYLGPWWLVKTLSHLVLSGFIFRWFVRWPRWRKPERFERQETARPQ